MDRQTERETESPRSRVEATVGKRTRKNRNMLKYILLDELLYEPACLSFTNFWHNVFLCEIIRSNVS